MNKRPTGTWKLDMAKWAIWWTRRELEQPCSIALSDSPAAFGVGVQRELAQVGRTWGVGAPTDWDCSHSPSQVDLEWSAGAVQEICDAAGGYTGMSCNWPIELSVSRKPSSSSPGKDLWNYVLVSQLECNHRQETVLTTLPRWQLGRVLFVLSSVFVSSVFASSVCYEEEREKADFGDYIRQKRTSIQCKSIGQIRPYSMNIIDPRWWPSEDKKISDAD